MHPMDSVFLLPDGSRIGFFHSIMRSFGCTYICLWSHFLHPSNRLISLDGFYDERSNQAGTSLASGSLPQTLFNEYKGSEFSLNNDGVPGLAFKNNCPYIELKELELQRFALNEIQRKFYQEARIQTAVFMGCNNGEIEIGFSRMSQADIQMALRNLFPEDFSRQTQHGIDQNPPSSSSSLSMDSPEYSSLLFNIPSTTRIPAEALIEVIPTISTTMQHPVAASTIATSSTPHQLQAIEAFSQIGNVQFPTTESEHAAITNAILAVLSSTSAASTSHQVLPSQQNFPSTRLVNSEAGAFKSYSSASLGLNTSQLRAKRHSQSMFKRSIAFFGSLNQMRFQGHLQATRPTSTQLHHMISERRRREKLNDNFQALRQLLPPETKKDKASILTKAKEVLRSLMDQVKELSNTNEQLEAQVLQSGEAKKEAAAETSSSSSNERLNVRVSHVAGTSSSEVQIVDLQVTLRGVCPHVDLLIRILEFLKQVKNISLISMDSNNQLIESTSINQVTLRLNIEGNEFDDTAFEEAVVRVVADLTQRHVDE
ncbi:Basic helix loop helix (BHLH) DNA-binding family protein [Quillaja saponaria]|uniref:Basic helix loop helix (BHLH) DNA-binding family protein n=1 Tax=Quillaja saponaria TaxID=32244 RepID=A0AAD7QD65_QUISA|nr:Basic helix loop helix (BHLH) DNA-binding family protein [Quillaja saponaria]